MHYSHLLDKQACRTGLYLWKNDLCKYLTLKKKKDIYRSAWKETSRDNGRQSRREQVCEQPLTRADPENKLRSH